jgi:hypothetical protein
MFDPRESGGLAALAVRGPAMQALTAFSALAAPLRRSRGSRGSGGQQPSMWGRIARIFMDER